MALPDLPALILNLLDILVPLYPARGTKLREPHTPVFFLCDEVTAAWCWCRLSVVPSEGLLGAFAAETELKLVQFAPQNISNVIWSYATMGITPGEDLWGFATIGYCPPRPFLAAAAQLCYQLIEMFNPQNIVRPHVKLCHWTCLLTFATAGQAALRTEANKGACSCRPMHCGVLQNLDTILAGEIP